MRPSLYLGLCPAVQEESKESSSSTKAALLEFKELFIACGKAYAGAMSLIAWELCIRWEYHTSHVRIGLHKVFERILPAAGLSIVHDIFDDNCSNPTNLF